MPGCSWTELMIGPDHPPGELPAHDRIGGGLDGKNDS